MVVVYELLAEHEGYGHYGFCPFVGKETDEGMRVQGVSEGD